MSDRDGADEKREEAGENRGPALDARRDRLDQALRSKRAESKSDEPPERTRGFAGIAQAIKLSSEFIAGVLVGGGLGWLVDYWLGTSPFGLIVLLLLGFVAGVLNSLRSARLVNDPFAGFPDGRSGDDRQDKTGR